MGFREKYLSKCLSLSYQQALKIVRGQGAFANILKIKSPLVFNQDDADKFLAVLQQGLTELNQLPQQQVNTIKDPNELPLA